MGDEARRPIAAISQVDGLQGALDSLGSSNARWGRVVCYGDSTTYGQNPPAAPYAATDVVGYPIFLAWLTHRSVVNAGYPGDQLQWWSSGGSRTLASVITTNGPSLIVFQIGSNDISTAGRTLAQMAVDYQAMSDYVRKLGIRQAYCTIDPRPSNAAIAQTILTANRWLERWCRAEGHLFIDTYSSFVDTAGAVLTGFQYDGTHPSSVGCHAKAKAVAVKIDDGIAPSIPGFWPGEVQGIPGNLFLLDTDSDGVGNSWTKAASAGVTGTCSIVARADGGRGNWQQIAKDAGGDISKYITTKVMLDPSSYGFGYSTDIEATIDTDAALNGCEWSLRMNWLTAASELIRTDYIGGDLVSAPVTSLRVFQTLTPPANTSLAQLFFCIYGAGAATARIGEVTAIKRTV